MINDIDNLLNKITMYKLVQWGLRILAAIALILSLIGALHIPFWSLVVSLVTLIVSCYVANVAFARIWQVPTNTESYVLTELILFLILPPPLKWTGAALIALAGVIAIASKFLITYRGKHLFNPAAFAAALLGGIGILHATWWVGNSLMWLPVLILGLLVVRKIRRFSLFLTFAVVALVVDALVTYLQHQPVASALQQTVASSPLLFLGTIMLTEPATMPNRRIHQVIFGGLVGVLYAWAPSIGPLIMYPETALLIGNLYAYAVNPRYRLHLTLERVEHLSERVANYVFRPNLQPVFAPGQYMEWTMDMPNHDSRGNRRTFSLASSPTENTVQIGVKFYDPSSRFKQMLRTMKPGDKIYAGQLAGDFTLPSNPSEKLVFIAGGIGITPFRSMLKYLIDKGEKRDITVIYAVSDPSEVAYSDVLKAAHDQLGIRIIPLLATDTPPVGWEGKSGNLSAEFISGTIPDYTDRNFYVSGPEGMVQSTRTALKKLGVSNVKTDHFSGY